MSREQVGLGSPGGESTIKECNCDMPDCGGGLLENRTWLAHQANRKRHDQREKDRSDLLVGYRSGDDAVAVDFDLRDSSDDESEHEHSEHGDVDEVDVDVDTDASEDADSASSSSSRSSSGSASDADSDIDAELAGDHAVRSQLHSALACGEKVFAGEGCDTREHELACALWAMQKRFNPPDELMQSVTGLLRMQVPAPNRVPHYRTWRRVTKEQRAPSALTSAQEPR